jgi:hypothetical protein
VLYNALAKRDVRSALGAAQHFGLVIGDGSDMPQLQHMSLSQKAQAALTMLTICFDTK